TGGAARRRLLLPFAEIAFGGDVSCRCPLKLSGKRCELTGGCRWDPRNLSICTSEEYSPADGMSAAAEKQDFGTSCGQLFYEVTSVWCLRGRIAWPGALGQAQSALTFAAVAASSSKRLQVIHP